MNIHYKQKYVISLNSLKGIDIEKIQIGIPVLDEEHKKISLSEIGDTVIPAPIFGNTCYKNVNGYSVAEKEKPKIERTICTVWVYPYGNTNRSPILCDIRRDCYQRVDIAPFGIELQLAEGRDRHKYIIAVLTPEIRKNFLKECINIFLEIFGECFVYTEGLQMYSADIHRVNWRILPPGEKPGLHLRGLASKDHIQVKRIQYERLDILDKCTDKIYAGVNGFYGYYAYLIGKICVLESALYGNAAYIISCDDWKNQSKRTKSELLADDKVLVKIEHKIDWKERILKAIELLS